MRTGPCGRPALRNLLLKPTLRYRALKGPAKRRPSPFRGKWRAQTITTALNRSRAFKAAHRGALSAAGLGRVITRCAVLSRPRSRCTMLGEHFRACFSDFDHRTSYGHQPTRVSRLYSVHVLYCNRHAAEGRARLSEVSMHLDRRDRGASVATADVGSCSATRAGTNTSAARSGAVSSGSITPWG